MDREAGVLDMSPLQMWAAQLHEMYIALLQAGFEPPAALLILTGMLHPGSD